MTLFVVLEGLDGVGKTSAAKALQSRLTDMGLRAHMVREPGYTLAGEDIRKILLTRQLDPLSQFYLFQAARMELMRSLEKTAAQYDYILMDRYWPSTLAYQVYGDGVSRELFEVANEQVESIRRTIGDLRIFLLTADRKTREIRQQLSGKRPDVIESRGPDYYTRVAEGYAYLATSGLVELVSTDKEIDRTVDYLTDRLRGM